MCTQSEHKVWWIVLKSMNNLQAIRRLVQLERRIYRRLRMRRSRSGKGSVSLLGGLDFILKIMECADSCKAG